MKSQTSFQMPTTFAERNYMFDEIRAHLLPLTVFACLQFYDISFKALKS